MKIMRWKSFGEFAKVLLETGIVCAIAIFALCPFSCRMTETGLSLYSLPQMDTPEITGISIESDRGLKMHCTKAVSVTEAAVTVNGEDSGIKVVPEKTDDGVVFHFDGSTEVGKDYEISGVIENADGSSLTFSLPFTGFNANPAHLVFSEIRCEMSHSSGTSIYKEEFVEFVAIKDGNIAGLEFVSGYDGEDKKFRFPAAEVEKGDYIVVHLRNREGDELCANETSEQRNLSQATDSCDEAIDFWVENSEARIGKNDVLILRNSFDGTLMDAVMFAESGRADWTKDLVKQFAQKAFAEGFWEGGDSTKFSIENKSTAARTLSRKNIAEILENGFSKGSKDQWLVAESSTKKNPGCTPGYKNIPE